MSLERKSIAEVFAEYDDDFILGAYKELLYLRKTGALPVEPKYFRELCDVRYRLFDDRSIDNTKRDLLDEIAKRWALIVEDTMND